MQIYFGVKLLNFLIVHRKSTKKFQITKKITLPFQKNKISDDKETF